MQKTWRVQGLILRIMKSFPSLCLLTIILAMCSFGCSVGMSLSGKPDPNLGIVKSGASRGEVELQLGEPVATIQEDGGCTRCLYEYSQGKNPSAGRAIAHGAMDVLTLGLWEIAGTPIEGFKGTKRRIQIVYGPDNKIINVLSAAPEPKTPPAAANPESQNPETK